MLYSSTSSSILIFEINKKYLLFKILSKEFHELLKDEIVKKFGRNYVDEKNLQSENFDDFKHENGKNFDENDEETDTDNTDRIDINEFSTETNDEDNKSSTYKSNKKQSKDLFFSDDLIYEYFSPIVNSFEISKEINFIYEYALFKKNQYIVRFNLHKNCLFMCVQDINSNNSKSFLKPTSEMTKLIYSDFASAWCCKSLISLFRFKFGICSDDKCFNNETNQIEIKELFTVWSNYYISDQTYFLEAIEQLDVSEDIKFRCKSFLDEFIDYMNTSESIMSDFDYMNENYDEFKTEFPFQFSNEEPYLNGNELGNENKYKIEALENFFTDMTQINQFVLTYGNKLLYKYKKSSGNESGNFPEMSNNAQYSNFSLASSSVFMILLEAANFLEYNPINPFKDDDIFKSGSISPIEHSINETDSSELMPSIGYQENSVFLTGESLIETFQSVKSSITSPTSIQNFKDFSPTINNKKSSFTNSVNNKLKNMDKSFLVDEELESFNIDKMKNFNKFKKTSCFLQNKNKSYGFYEILYLKLSENLCLILLKENKLSKYCDLILDFEALIDSLIDLLNKKRLLLSAVETDSSTQTSFSPSPKETKESSPSGAFKNKNDGLSFSKRNIQDERIDKTFFSFFMNKLIFFYDKLTNLKNELNTRNSGNNNQSKNNGFFSNTFKIRQRSFSIDNNLNENNKKNKNSLNKSSSSTELSNKNSIKLIHTLQIKINQLSGSSQFKQFIGFINNGQDTSALPKNSTEFKSNNDLLACFRMIESQINLIRANLNELFYELFLANYITVTHELPNLNKNSTDSSKVNNPIFKSTHFLICLKELFKKNLFHYTPFMDLKLKRNIAMSFYWHQFPGLIHFSFINRQDNVCVIPTIDESFEYNLNEFKINLAYRKYMPIVLSFLYKNDCTQFQFTDDKLELVFSYHLWFEDRNSNYIPVDFNTINNLYNNYNNLLENTNKLTNNKQFFETKSNLLYQKSQLANIARDRNQYHHFGITEKSYYDLIKTLCYPNAPAESLTCYELVCIHSSRISEDTVKSQFKYLVTNFCQKFIKTQ